jgi:hypothetical protein
MRRVFQKLVRNTRPATALLFGLSVALAAGCGDGGTAADVADDSVAETRQALSSCGGTVVKTGSISDQFGAPLGTVYLYYSSTTSSICGLASFTAAHGSFQICATNHTDLSQPPKCLSYSSATFVGATPDQFLRIGDTGSTSVFVNSPTLGSGGAGFFTRTF